MIKHIKKCWKQLLMVFVMLFSIGTNVTNNVDAFGSTVNFQRVREIKYPKEIGNWSTWLCTIDGNLAYCLNASKNTPPVNAWAPYVIANNDALLKVLYYGYGGPGDVFKIDDTTSSEDVKYIYTHMMASYAYSGDLYGNNSWDSLQAKGYAIVERWNQIQALPLPENVLKFNNEKNPTFTAYVENGYQRTQDITLNSNTSVTVNIPLQAGVELHNVTKGTISTGNVAVNGGDTFYLKAPLNKIDDYSSGQLNGDGLLMYAPLVIESKNGNQAEGTLSTSIDPSTIQLNISWMKLGSLEITKTNTNADLIDGAEFILKSTDGSIERNIVVKDGKIKEENLPMGEYTLKEVNAPDGYLINTETFNITINQDQTTQQTVVDNEPLGKIDLTKIINTDATNGMLGESNLVGNEYSLLAKEDITNKAGTITYFKKGATVDKKVTDATGKLKFENLHVGNYTIKETKSNSTLVLNNKTIDVSVNYEGQTTSNISTTTTTDNRVNMQKIQIFKSGEKESISGIVKGLQGAEFTFKLKSEVDHVGWDNAQTYDKITTNKDGKANTKYLPYGEYLVKETKTPKDYITAPDFTVSVTKDFTEYEDIEQVKVINVNNRPYTSQLKIVKQDADSAKTVSLNSTTFKIKARENILENGKVVYKAGETIKQKVAGKTYSSFTTNADNVIVPDGSYASDNDKGSTVLPLNLGAGKYYIDEIKTPKGYLALDKVLDFSIENIRDYDVDEDGDPLLKITVKNAKPVAQLIVNKTVDINENADKTFIEDLDLSGIKFKLSAKKDVLDMADGSVIYAKGATVGEYNLSTDGHLTVNDLPMGEYTLQEIETLDGLVLDNTKHDVIFNQTDLTTKVYTVTKDLVNYPTKFEISKTDVTGEKELAGASMQVLDKDGTVIDSWISGTKTHIIEGLKVNETYTLVEDFAPLGYVKATSIDFTVKNTSDMQKVHMIDKVMTINKVDVDGKGLEGATLQIVSTKTKNIIDQWISDKTGTHNASNLVAGETYILQEVDAPDSYVKATSIEFTVKDDNKNQSLDMVDKQVTITKKDVAGEEVEGAKIQVIDDEGNVVDEWISSNEPHFVDNLEEGKTYTMHEDLAPNGFNVVNDIEFTVTKDKENQAFEMVDTLTNVNKVDEDGNHLPGATLQIVNAKTKNIVEQWTTGQHLFDIDDKIKAQLENGKTVSNMMIDDEDGTIEYTITPNADSNDFTLKVLKDGIVTYSMIDIKGNETTHLAQGLEQGQSYILQEVDAPNGYATAEDQSFTLEDKDVTLTMTDEITKFEIHKQDITNQQELEGASLEVVDDQGNVVDSWISTTEAHTIQGLEVGKTYKLNETIAPVGYSIAQSVEFKVEDTGEVQQVIIYDELLPVAKKVKTGDEKNTEGFEVLGSLSLLALGLMLITRKKENLD